MRRPTHRPTAAPRTTLRTLRFAIGLVLLLGLLAAPALAQDDEEALDRAGPYIEIGAGVAYFPLIAEWYEGRSSSTYSMKEQPTIYPSFGYRATSHFSFELQTQYFFDGSLESGKRKAGDIYGLAVTTNGKGYLATGELQPYLTVGLGVLSIGLKPDDPQLPSSNRLGLALRGGLGAEYYLSETVGIDIGATWIHGQGPARHYDVVVGTANLILRF